MPSWAVFWQKKAYQVEDPEILSSILYHTTGKPAMTTLEQIIYIADYIEINRKKLPGMEVTRKLAFTDLDACMLHILESTLAFLEKTGAAIDQITMETYTYYKERVQHDNEAQKGDTHDEVAQSKKMALAAIRRTGTRKKQKISV